MYFNLVCNCALIGQGYVWIFRRWKPYVPSSVSFSRAICIDIPIVETLRSILRRIPTMEILHSIIRQILGIYEYSGGGTLRSILRQIPVVETLCSEPPLGFPTQSSGDRYPIERQHLRYVDFWVKYPRTTYHPVHIQFTMSISRSLRPHCTKHEGHYI